MLVVMKPDATEQEAHRVCQAVRALGLTPHPVVGSLRTAIGITGNAGAIDPAPFSVLPGVAEIIRVSKPYRLTSRELKPEGTIVRVGETEVGGPELVIIAGPCCVESREQTVELARQLRELGVHLLRGGAFKPRTSPYAFQGLGRAGLEILAEARAVSSLPVVSELISADDLPHLEQHVDVIQIGARNMQNYPLLRKVGRGDRPVLLKRSFGATLEELLLAAEHILAEGNPNVILCERGIRTFSDACRFTLDLGSVPELKRLSHLPVIVDPSHAAGRRSLVVPLARAAVAAGADGVMLEVHAEPQRALSDGGQSLTLPMFAELLESLRAIASVVRREPAAAR